MLHLWSVSLANALQSLPALFIFVAMGIALQQLVLFLFAKINQTSPVKASLSRKPVVLAFAITTLTILFWVSVLLGATPVFIVKTLLLLGIILFVMTSTFALITFLINKSTFSMVTRHATSQEELAFLTLNPNIAIHRERVRVKEDRDAKKAQATQSTPTPANEANAALVNPKNVNPENVNEETR